MSSITAHIKAKESLQSAGLLASVPQGNVENRARSSSKLMRIFSGRQSKKEPKTAYEGLQLVQGTEDLKQWYLLNATPAGMDELMFVKVMKNIARMPDFALLDILDLIDHGTGHVAFAEFHLTMSFFCALESGQFTHFFFVHGKSLFRLLASGQPACVHRTALLPFVACVGMTEAQLSQYFAKFEVSTPVLDFQKYVLVMSCVADDWDSKLNQQPNRLNKRKRGKRRPHNKDKDNKDGKNKEGVRDDSFALDDSDEEEFMVPGEAGLRRVSFEDELALLSGRAPKPFALPSPREGIAMGVDGDHGAPQDDGCAVS